IGAHQVTASYAGDGNFLGSGTVGSLGHSVVSAGNPTASISGALLTNTGTTYTLYLSSHDPNGFAFLGWTIHWGDGAISTGVTGTSVTHVYNETAVANETIDATATYADGDAHAAS